MLYLPKQGYMWDTSIVYHNDEYYLFSMFNFPGEKADCINVWCAKSMDGVHFEDVGAVIKDQPFIIWKMFVHKYGDTFVMNHGSLSGKPGHGNDTLCFWKSDNLIDWEYLGKDADSNPDPRWYNIQKRWDHMYTLEHKGRYYGFCVATTNDNIPYKSCGLMVSDDGVRWEALPPPVVEWGDIPQQGFEVGGCEKIGDKYYLIGGCCGMYGNAGYCVFAFVADDPMGPYKPLEPKFRLCGSSGSKHRIGVQWLASFGRGKDNELLITNYLTAPTSEHLNFIGTKEDVWFLPIKKAVVDNNGMLRMAYWKQNELLKGDKLPISFDKLKVFGDEALVTKGDALKISTEDFSAKSFSKESLEPKINAVVFEDRLPTEEGVFIEGTVTVKRVGKLNTSKFGCIICEPDDTATVMLMDANHERVRKTVIQTTDLKSFSSEIIDVIDYNCASENGVSIDEPCSFKLLIRRNIFEVYLNDILVQSFITRNKPDGCIGFMAQDCLLNIDNLTIYKMK
jgi:hypothetical protein